MNINLTLIVQMLVFIVLIWFTMKFVWPMILGPMDERSRKIALGLAAAEKGQQEEVAVPARERQPLEAPDQFGGFFCVCANRPPSHRTVGS